MQQRSKSKDGDLFQLQLSRILHKDNSHCSVVQFDRYKSAAERIIHFRKQVQSKEKFAQERFAEVLSRSSSQSVLSDSVLSKSYNDFGHTSRHNRGPLQFKYKLLNSYFLVRHIEYTPKLNISISKRQQDQASTRALSMPLPVLPPISKGKPDQSSVQNFLIDLTKHSHCNYHLPKQLNQSQYHLLKKENSNLLFVDHQMPPRDRAYSLDSQQQLKRASQFRLFFWKNIDHRGVVSPLSDHLSNILALLSKQQIVWLFQDQTYNSQGIYFVKLFKNGVWRYIVVDDHLVVDKKGKIQSAVTVSYEFWPALIEKAIWKSQGRQLGISRLLQLLTGGIIFDLKQGLQTSRIDLGISMDKQQTVLKKFSVETFKRRTQSSDQYLIGAILKRINQYERSIRVRLYPRRKACVKVSAEGLDSVLQIFKKKIVQFKAVLLSVDYCFLGLLQDYIILKQHQQVLIVILSQLEQQCDVYIRSISAGGSRLIQLKLKDELACQAFRRMNVASPQRAVNNQLRALLTNFNRVLQVKIRELQNPMLKKAFEDFIFVCQQPQEDRTLTKQSSIIRQYLILVFESLLSIKEFHSLESFDLQARLSDRLINQIQKVKINRLSSEVQSLHQQNCSLRVQLVSLKINPQDTLFIPDLQVSFPPQDFHYLQKPQSDSKGMPKLGQRLTFKKMNENLKTKRSIVDCRAKQLRDRIKTEVLRIS